MIGLVCSFIWIRGSKHSFLTSFSNFYCYFPFSSIFATLLLTSFFAPFSVAPDSNFLSRFHTFCTPDTTSYMRPHISGTHNRLSQSKKLVGTLYKNLYRHSFPVPPFFAKVSHANVYWAIVYHTFSSHLNPQTDIFLRDISLRKVNAVQPKTGIAKGFPYL